MNPNLNDLYVTLIIIVITLNGISIPLSYNTISENLKPYLDKNMYKKFLEEESFRTNIIVSIWSLVIFGVPLIFDISVIDKPFFAVQYYEALQLLHIIISIGCISGFLISFFDFSRMIYEYAANTEEVVFNKLKEELDEILP